MFFDYYSIVYSKFDFSLHQSSSISSPFRNLHRRELCHSLIRMISSHSDITRYDFKVVMRNRLGMNGMSDHIKVSVDGPETSLKEIGPRFELRRTFCYLFSYILE